MCVHKQHAMLSSLSLPLKTSPHRGIAGANLTNTRLKHALCLNDANFDGANLDHSDLKIQKDGTLSIPLSSNVPGLNLY